MTTKKKEVRLCSLIGCDKKHHGHGLCMRHLNQKRRGTLRYVPAMVDGPDCAECGAGATYGVKDAKTSICVGWLWFDRARVALKAAEVLNATFSEGKKAGRREKES